MKKLFSECLHKELNNKCGIYLIVCKNHKYVGSSINIYYRLKRHTSDLKSKKHSNMYLQNVYNKHGEESFTFKILEKCEKDNLCSRELY